MSLLTIGQDVSDEIGFKRPSTITGASTDDARTLLRLANKVGVRLMKCFPWTIISKERTFTGVAGETQTSILPSDFNRFIKDAFWDRTGNRVLTGPISAAEWQGLKSHNYSEVYTRFYKRGTDILMNPALGGGESLAFEYVSKNWCTDSTGTTPKSAMTADDDEPLIDSELLTLGMVFEYLDSKGQPTAKAARDYLEAFEQETNNDRPGDDEVAVGDIFAGSQASRLYSGHPPSGEFWRS